ncbi:MAG TPA: hypothetical protein DEB39_11235 [Planctomycetaceae bacterium]|nr:hypothetical protein [Planctomycetaceae bacterium]
MPNTPTDKADSNAASVLPRNVRLTVEPDRLEIEYFSRCMLRFDLPIFGAIWTAATVGGTITEIEKGVSWNILLILPFWVVAFGILCAILRNFFHRERLRIDADGLDWRLATGVTVYRRRVPWDRLIAIQVGCHYGPNKFITGWGMGVETDERSFYIFLDMDFEGDGKILRQTVKDFIADYRERYSLPEPSCSGVIRPSKVRRRDTLCLRETPERLEIEGAPGGRLEEQIFSLVWITGWTACCIALPFSLFPPHENMPLWVVLIIITIFWASWLFAVPMLLLMLWRWESLRVDSEGIEYRLAIRLPFLLIPLRTRRVPLRDLGLAETSRVSNGSYTNCGLEIATTGRAIRCFNTRNSNVGIAELILPLNKRLEQYGVTPKSRRRDFLENNPANGPLDSRWAFHNDGLGSGLTRRGRVTARMFGVMLFACVFINGTLAVAAVGIISLWQQKIVPFHFACIATLIFSLFLLFGVWTLCLAMMTLLQPFRRYAIMIDDQRIRYRCTLFGIGRRRSWDRSDVAKVKVVRRANPLRWYDTAINPELGESEDGKTNPYPFAVHLFDAEGELIGLIPGLLEGEARWIASLIR